MADDRFSVPSYLGKAEENEISKEIAALPVGQAPARREIPSGSAGTPPQEASTSAPAAAGPQRFQTSDLPREAYADMPFSEVGSRALSNALPSAGNALKGMYDAVVNYEDTAGAISQLGKGVASKVRGAFGGERNMEAETVADALGAMYADRYGSTAGFKEALAEDPFSIGLDAASVAPVVGVAGRAAGLGPVATGLQKVAALGDPVNLAVQGTKIATRGAALPVTTVGRYAQGAASGVPQSVLKIAEQAGRTGNPAQKSAFLTFAMGRGDHRDIAKAAMEAVEELRAKTSADYVARRSALTTQELPMTEIKASLQNLKNQLDPHSLGLFPQLRNVLDEMENQIRAVELSSNPAARSAEGLDRLKRSLNDVAAEMRGTQHAGAVAEVPRSVRDTIATFDNGYAEMMDRWQKWRNELLDFQRTLGTSDKVAESARLAKLLSTARKEDKMSLLQELARKTQSGQLLPYMIAGATVEHSLPPYLQGMGLMGAGAIAAGGIHGASAAALGSPRLAGITQYGAGRLQGAVGSIPAPPAAASNLLSQIGQDRIARKSGGRVGVDHEKLADQLVGAAERAKKGISSETEALLDVHDDHIAHALEVANRSI